MKNPTETVYAFPKALSNERAVMPGRDEVSVVVQLVVGPAFCNEATFIECGFYMMRSRREFKKILSGLMRGERVIKNIKIS